MPQPALLSTITTILRGEDPARRRLELTALRDQAPLETLDAIISLLGSPEQEVRRRAGKSLSIFRDYLESRGQALVEHLVQNADSHIRLSCAIKLMDNPSTPVTLAYRRALEDPFDKVAQVACLEVGHRGGVGSTEALMRTLDRNSWRVRLEACKALITQGTADGRVVATLEAMAQEPEARVYDTECDEFEAIGQEVQRETGEALPWGRFWGKLETILNQARSVARAGHRAEPGAPPNGGPTKSFGDSEASGGPPSVS
jgi:hypothetical protein